MSSSISWTDDDAVLLKYAPGDTIAGESFTRSTTATYKNTSGVVTTAAINVKRDFHWNTALGFRTLLLEDTRTNNFIRSEEFDNAVWTKSGATVAANTALDGPNATLTADKLQEDNANSAHSITSPNMTTTANTDQAVSVFAHAGERTWLRISSVSRAGTVRNSWVNLTTGAIGTKDAGHVIRVEAFYNNWFRVEMVFNADAGGGAVNAFFSVSTADNVTAYLGTTGSGIYLWGADHEQDRSFATSYIPTTTVAVTRGADTYSLPFTTPPQEMTVYAKFVEGGTFTQTGVVVAISNAAGASSYYLLYSSVFRYAAQTQGTGAVAASVVATPPVLGDVVELAGSLYGDGSVGITQSLNSGTAISGTQSAPTPLDAAWSGQLAWLNSFGTTGPNRGFTALQSFKIVAGARSLTEMRAIASPISFSNGRPTPLDRLANWTPMSKPIGPAETALGTGQRYTFRFRTDHTVSFEIRNIPNTLLWQALRLQDHLLRGGIVAINTGDSVDAHYYQCCLAPDSVPQITMSDPRALEYTFSVALLNVAGTPFRMLAVY